MPDFDFGKWTLAGAGNKRPRLYRAGVSFHRVYLGRREMGILHVLVQARGEVVPGIILAMVWNDPGGRLAPHGVAGAVRRLPSDPGAFLAVGVALKQAIYRLRRRLGAGSILAERGQGYRIGWKVERRLVNLSWPGRR